MTEFELLSLFNEFLDGAFSRLADFMCGHGTDAHRCLCGQPCLLAAGAEGAGADRIS
jgi:hypothetical protein